MEIINTDAQKYTSSEVFDYVLVDMYLGDKLPKFVYSDKFLQKRLGQIVVFNHLFHTDDQKQNAEKLTAKLRQIYPSIKLIRILTNLMIICA